MNAENRSIKSKILSGSIWTVTGYTVSQLIRLGNHLVLAWFLTPQIFGLMALVKVVQQGLHMFSDIGIKPSIIQNNRGDDQEFLNTAWTIQIIRGVMLWLIACILSWPVAALFARNDPAAWQLWYVIPVASFISVIDGFKSTALATLNRNMKLGRVTLLELAKQVVSIIVMIVWAFIHPTLWALVFGGLAGSAFNTLASHKIVPGYKVHIAWNKKCVQELIVFGRWIFLSTAFSFLAMNLDKVILGNILTLEELGLYSIALVFTRVALHVGLKISDTVLFPVYSRLKEQPQRMMHVALQTRKIVLFAGMSVVLFFAIGAPLFFEILWDPRYHQAGYLSQWLSLYMWAMLIMLTINGIPLAMGNSKALFFSNIVQCSGSIIAVVGYGFGKLPGFIIGLSLGPLIAHFFILRYIPVKRNLIIRQGFFYSFICISYVFLSINITMWIDAHMVMFVKNMSIVFFSLAPLIISGLIIINYIRKEFKVA